MTTQAQKASEEKVKKKIVEFHMAGKCDRNGNPYPKRKTQEPVMFNSELYRQNYDRIFRKGK